MNEDALLVLMIALMTNIGAVILLIIGINDQSVLEIHTAIALSVISGLAVIATLILNQKCFGEPK